MASWCGPESVSLPTAGFPTTFRRERAAGDGVKRVGPRAARLPPGDPGDLPPYAVMRLTGRFFISHSPVFRSYTQLQNASQFSLSISGVSVRK